MASSRSAPPVADPSRRTLPRTPGPQSVSPGRRCAFVVLRRVFEDGAYADRALHAEAGDLEPRDRALAMRLSFGAVQRRGTLDHLIETLTDRGIERLDRPVLAALRLGLYELLYTERVAAHASVNDAVEVTKASGPGGTRLVNAVLRRAAREGTALIRALTDDTPEEAALLHSLPPWIARAWWNAFGGREARALMARVNEPAESALRANTLVSSAPELRRHLPVRAHLYPALEEALILDEPFDAHGSPLWGQGAFMPQSRASMLTARAVGPRPGDRILDLCAAPGAKTTHLAALTGDRAEILAVERHPGRAQALRTTCERMRATSVTVEVGDAGEPRPAADQFDRVLVDPPCSGLGTLQSRPDLRWRVTPESVRGAVAEQRRILDAATGAVRPGGLLVYSTCTLSAEENEHQIARFLEAHRDFQPAPLDADLAPWQHPELPGALLALPHRHSTDGFFIARLRRNDTPGSGR